MASSVPLIGLVLAGSASLADFEAHLATRDSATQALQEWCEARHIGEGPIRADVLSAQSNDPPAKMRRILDLGGRDGFAMRNVRLTCGDKVLSQADNWYLPGQLTDDMNRRLEQTRTPFGVVVKGLNFTRRNLKTDVLFKDGRGVPPLVLRHAALLLKADGTAFSYVVETYTDQVLAAGP